ncbi:MAG: hypothetical protein JWR25_2255 [Noviherbaspirillum sp.]|nr:hypothetical protein [Noviherbaspirillum sp.]
MIGSNSLPSHFFAYYPDDNPKDPRNDKENFPRIETAIQESSQSSGKQFVTLNGYRFGNPKSYDDDTQSTSVKLDVLVHGMWTVCTILKRRMSRCRP